MSYHMIKKSKSCLEMFPWLPDKHNFAEIYSLRQTALSSGWVVLVTFYILVNISCRTEITDSLFSREKHVAT